MSCTKKLGGSQAALTMASVQRIFSSSALGKTRPEFVETKLGVSVVETLMTIRQGPSVSRECNAKQVVSAAKFKRKSVLPTPPASL
jgi:hypothetical protein